MSGSVAPRWNLQETRDHIVRLYGRDQLGLANPCINSVADRQTYARIHFQDARAKMDAYVQAELEDKSLFDITFRGDDDAWTEFNFFLREAGAYLTACVQSIHSTPDILANAIYYSLGFNLLSKPLKPKAIASASVLKLMKEDLQLAALADSFEQIIYGGAFAHLSALANHAKHRSIVSPSLNEDWTGERKERHMVTFPAFQYEGNVYPQVFADELLNAEYDRCSKLIVTLGVELNAVLQGACSRSLVG